MWIGTVCYVVSKHASSIIIHFLPFKKVTFELYFMILKSQFPVLKFLYISFQHSQRDNFIDNVKSSTISLNMVCWSPVKLTAFFLGFLLVIIQAGLNGTTRGKKSRDLFQDWTTSPQKGKKKKKVANMNNFVYVGFYLFVVNFHGNMIKTFRENYGNH